MTSLISPSERDFIISGIDADVRADGRSRLDYRHLEIQTSVISQANGSSRVTLAGTEILVGVKVEMGSLADEMSQHSAFLQQQDLFPCPKNRGKVVCSVECSPSASQAFEGRGSEDVNVELTQIVSRVYSSSHCGLDLDALCIIPGQQCWIVYVDAIVLGYAGNVVDVLFMAIKAALYNTRIPKVDVIDLGEGQYDFEIPDEGESAMLPLSGRDQTPVCISLSKIGKRYIVDANIQEEQCLSSTLHICLNSRGQLISIQKSGESWDGGMEPSRLLDMIQTAAEVGTALYHQLEKALKE